MKLKEIKPGMKIHCNSLEEYNLLEEEVKRLGYGKLPIRGVALSGKIGEHVFHIPEDKEYKILWEYYHDDRSYTEFSDLIVPEMSAEEVLQICSEICNGGPCDECIIGEENCFAEPYSDKKKVIEICQKWKSDHEKKEPEIETVDVCRIIKILPDRKMVVHEEDIKSELPFGGDERQKVEEILKRYCMEHDGEYIAVHEVVSRVKAVE